jgi:hypothetical protein
MKKSTFILFVALGTAFWFQAAMIIKLAGATVFSEKNPMLIWFWLLVIPVTSVSLWITKVVSKLLYQELLKPVVIMTFTAAFLDAVALTWFRQLYSESYEVALYGAAWILWGAGVGLLFSFYLDVKGKKGRLNKELVNNN